VAKRNCGSVSAPSKHATGSAGRRMEGERDGAFMGSKVVKRTEGLEFCRSTAECGK
jgi:hypothetical protein